MNIIKIKNFCLSLIAFTALTFCLSCSSDEEEELIGNWTTLGSFDGAARGEAVGFVIGDTAYICLGYNAKAAGLSDLWRYNPSDKTWKRRADFPGPARYSASAFSVGGKAYVGLGYDGKVVYKDFWEYDPKTNAWTEVAELFPGIERYYAVAAAVGSKGYVGTGNDGGSFLKDFFSFTPGATPGSGTWAEISSYEGSKRQGASVFVIGNNLYLFGGESNGGNPVDMQKYDASSGNWTKVMDIRNTDLTDVDDEYDNIPRSHAAAFVINGKGYLTLGLKSALVLSTYEYDPTANIWLKRTPFAASSRQGAVTFSLNESGKTRGFVLTGRSGTSARYDDFFEFFPTAVNNTYDDY
jgi:N-acetylneuraminic acid mutarotase